jgi:hypothetical protein
MRFEPKTEEQCGMALLKPGECEFEVKAATDETSSKGNDMIKLTLECYDADGNKAVVFDYLLEAMAAKLRHFARAVGLYDEYDAGELSAADCIGRTGKCKIKHDKATAQDPAKNAIVDYIGPTGTTSKPASQAADAPPPGTDDAARREAWAKFKAAHDGLSADQMNKEWVKAFRHYFAGRPHTEVKAREWRKFADDGFAPPKVPVSSDQAFKDDDIPF